MEGIIDHVMINANDHKRAVEFYSWLMPKLGYPEKMDHGKSVGFRSPNGSVWVTGTGEEYKSQAFSKERVGLRELAFRAESPSEIDEIAGEVEKNGGKIIKKPYTNDRGDCQFFFSDPEGMKLEIIARKKQGSH